MDAEIIDYTPLLLDILDSFQSAISVMTGICCFIGVVAGLVLIKILFDRM